MSRPTQHFIQNGDQPHEDLASCEASGCGWSFRHNDRRVRAAASYRHIAEMIEASIKETNVKE